MTDQPVIVAAKRTPIGKFFGGLMNVPSPTLGSYAIRAVLDEAPAAKDHIDQCIMGCVLQTGLGQNPARQAGLGAGLPSTLNAITVNKVCGSGLQAVMQAYSEIMAGEAECVIAGGFENMTAAPHYAKIRTGVKYGPAELQDSMANDGLSCAFEAWPMGNAAEHIAAKHAISREDQDRFGAQSHQRAAAAWDNGWYDDEVVTLTGEQVGNRKNPGPEGGVQRDEGIRADSTAESLSHLRPVFAKDGTVTAGNASQISDGAAAALVMSESKADSLGIKPMARILSKATSGVEPRDIFEAPIEAPRGTGLSRRLGKMSAGRDATASRRAQGSS